MMEQAGLSDLLWHCVVPDSSYRMIGKLRAYKMFHVAEYALVTCSYWVRCRP